MTAHLTSQAIERMRRNELAGAEMFDALEHVENCETCAANARVQLAPEIDALVADLTGGGDAAGSAGVDAGAPRRWWWLAAAAAIVIVVTAIVLLRRPEAAPPQAPVIAEPSRPAPTPTQPPAPRYANAEWESLVATATRTNQLPYPSDLASLESHEIVLRGGPSAAPARFVPSGVVVDETRPPFAWPEERGATYSVAIFEDEQEVMRSPSLRVARWTPAQPLRRGRTYTWQIAVRKDDATEFIPAPPAPIAMFRITTDEQHRDLELARQQHRGDHALLAVLHARAGMRAEAEEAWQRRAE